jgi:hypothetical protein
VIVEWSSKCRSIQQDSEPLWSVKYWKWEGEWCDVRWEDSRIERYGSESPLFLRKMCLRGSLPLDLLADVISESHIDYDSQ